MSATAGSPDPQLDQRFEEAILRGGSLLRDDQVEAARVELREAMRLRPRDVRGLALLGLACFRLDAFAEALGVYQALVAEQPADASYRLNLGLVHLKLGDARAAVAELTRSRELDPSQVRTVGYLGLAYARAGQYAEAYRAFLLAEQPALAREMEQYLSGDERQAIRARLAGEAAPETTTAAAAPPTIDPRARPAPVEPLVAPVVAPPTLDPEAQPAPSEPVAMPADGGTAGTRGDADRRADAAAADDDADGDAEVAIERIASDEELSFDTPPSAARAVVLDAEDAIIAEIARPPVSGGDGMVGRALAVATPSATPVTRVARGHSAPRPVGAWATERLIRPGDGEAAIELSDDGALVVRVAGRILSRAEGVVATGGELAFEPATRRVRGAAVDEPIGRGAGRLFVVSGQGYLVAAPGGGPDGPVFTALALDGDILYVREDLVFAFEERLRWESGHVPGSGSTIKVIQLRGEGAVALRGPRSLVGLALAPERPVHVEAGALAGWIGRVVPRVVGRGGGAAGGRRPVADGDGEAAGALVECAGEGIVLIEPRGASGAR